MLYRCSPTCIPPRRPCRRKSPFLPSQPPTAPAAPLVATPQPRGMCPAQPAPHAPKPLHPCPSSHECRGPSSAVSRATIAMHSKLPSLLRTAATQFSPSTRLPLSAHARHPFFHRQESLPRAFCRPLHRSASCGAQGQHHRIAHCTRGPIPRAPYNLSNQPMLALLDSNQQVGALEPTTCPEY
jgi:hypothetical protein